jgi:hypothetical protein
MSESTSKKQAYRHVLSMLMLMILGFVLTGCGKRATMVDAPDSVTDDTFPRVYPDPATDPKPGDPQK